MLKVYPYKQGSKSAKDLARALGVKRIKVQGRYVPPANATIINWGSSRIRFDRPNILNKASAVRKASNKLTALQIMKNAGVSVPDFTTDREEAATWQSEGYRVLCRHLLRSHSGRGIKVTYPDELLDYAPLYTKYHKKRSEYRIHVFKGKVIDMCAKRQRTGFPAEASLIRTYENGWVFCRNNLDVPIEVQRSAIKAVECLGLDFGAVDVIVRKNKHWVLEVNTAPGLQGTTLEAYARELRDYV